MLSNSGRDERGLYSGGQAGDQDGGEWAIVPWYNYPWGGWDYVLHHPDSNVRALIAKLATEAAHNNNIGYDQSERYTFWEQLSQCGFRPANIQTPCESDCSAGVLAIVKAVGYLTGNERLKAVSIYGYTGNERDILTSAGFQCMNGVKYLTSDDYLYAGDILLNEENHTCTCVTDGSKAGEEPKDYFVFKTRQLSLGYKSIEDVYVLECVLKCRTFYDGDIDGKFGGDVDAGVRRFQRKAHIKEDGVAGYDTFCKLYALQYLGETNGKMLWAIKQTESGTDHTDSTLLMQEMLKIKKFYKGKLDGQYGKETEKAVRAFQKKYQKLGLEVTGRCDIKTIEKIMTATSVLKKQLEEAA